MKKLLTGLMVLSFVVSAQVFAAPQAEESQNNSECTAAPAPDAATSELAKLFDANGVSMSASADSAAWGYWHCTAYPEGHGHTGGVSYFDVHYDHAYYGAMQACERSWPGHHCHDVHCHVDQN